MLDVVYCCNNNFAPYVGVSMASFLENNVGDFDKIILHIVNDNVSIENKKKLTTIVNNYDCVYIKFHSFDIVNYNINSEKTFNMHTIAFSVLFLSSILKNIDKVLYLDADSLITGSFKDLINNVNIENKFGAAVLDVVRPYHKKNLNILGKDYYNTGMIWMNLNYIRDKNLEKEFINIINTRDYIPLCDQDVIGIAVDDKDVVKLPPKYNLFGYFLEFSYENVMKVFSLDSKEYYPKIDIIEAKKSPIFNHFINLFAGAPWNDKSNPIHDLYVSYANFTPFDLSEVFQEKKLSLWRRILFNLIHIIPESLFVKLCSIYLKRVLDEPNLNKS